MKFVRRKRRHHQRRSRNRRFEHRFRSLQIEPLENRLVLATLTWDGGGDGISWNDPLNWTEDRRPGESDDVIIDAPGELLVRVRGDQPAIRSLVNHETIHIDGNRTTGFARLTVTSGLTNHGTLRLETTSNDHHDRSSHLVVGPEGLLRNAASGVIDVRVGAGDGREISASIVNQGKLLVEAGNSLIVRNGSAGFAQEDGQIAALGELVLVGGSFDFLGGDVEGLVRLQSADIYVAASVTDTATLRAVGPGGKLRGNEADQITIWVEGTTRFGAARLATQEGAVNRGTLRLETTSNDHHDRGSYLRLDGSTFTNEIGGVIDIQEGTGDNRTIIGHLTNRGQVIVGDGESAEFFGTLVSDGGTYRGDLRFRDVQLSFLRPPIEPTRVQLYGGHNVLRTDIPAGQTVDLLGTTTYGAAGLRSRLGFVNQGILRLEAISNDQHDRGSYVTIDEGVLLNSTEGTIDVRTGAGDPRRITGNVTNRGSLLIEGGTTLTVSNPGAFHQEHGKLHASGQFFLEGGTFDFTGGDIEGLVRLRDADLFIADTVTDAATLRAVGPNGKFRGNHGENTTVWIEGTTTWGAARLSTTEGALNRGTLRLETTSNDQHDRGSYLRLDGSTFTNEIGGIIDIQEGTGDNRTIIGHLTNRGQVLVGDGESAEFFGTLVSDGGTYRGDLRFRDIQLSFLRPPIEPTRVQLYGGHNILHTDIPAGQTVDVLGATTYGAAGLRSPLGFINQGHLRLEAISNDHHDRGSYVTIDEGILLNSAGGTIDVRTGAGDPRRITGSITNRGSLLIEGGTTLTVSNPGAFHQEQGKLHASGQFFLEGGTFDFTGGDIEGLVRLRNANLFIADTVTDAATLRAVGPNGTFRGNHGEEITVWIEGTTTWGAARLSTTEDALNRGTLRLETTSNDHHDRGSYLRIDGATFTNEAGGLIDIQEGAGDGRTITGHFTNRGRVSVGDGESADFFGTLISDGGVYSGDLRLHNVQLSFLRSPTESTEVQLFGGENILHTDIPPGQTVNLFGTTTYGHARLTSLTGFVNYGHVRLETLSNDQHDRGVLLAVDSGTLFNAPQGVLEVRAGQGDPRTIRGQFRNEGTLIVDTPTTLTGNGAEHVNAGIIGILAGTLSVQGSSFRNAEAALIGGGGALNTSGVTFQNEGTVDLSPPNLINVELDPGLIIVSFHSTVGMDPVSATDLANYQLIGSGGDGTFHDGNEQILTARISSISFDLDSQTVSLQLAQPLDQDIYRLAINGDAVTDSNATPLHAGETVTVMRHLGRLPTLIELDLQSASDSGLFDSDDLTNNTTPTFDVTVNRTGTIALAVKNDNVPDVTVAANTPGTYALTSPPLSHGTHTVTAHFTPTFGETASTSLQVTVDIRGPHLLSGRASEQAPATQRLLEFSEPLDPASAAAAVSLMGPSGPVAIDAVSVDGARLLVHFPAQITPGEYTLTSDSQIRDLAGNLLDQNQNGVNGEQGLDRVVDRFTLLSDVTGPFVAELLPQGPLNTDLGALHITFNERIQAGSLTADDVRIEGPLGPLNSASLTVTPLDAWRFAVTLPPQSVEGTYRVMIGPDVRDLSGNSMPAAHSAALELDKTGPRVTSMTPAGTVSQAVDHLLLVFDSPVDPATFNAADIAVTGPAGPVTIQSVTRTGERSWRVSFAPQRASGQYDVRIGPSIADVAGNAMDQNRDGVNGTAADAFESTFSIQLANLVPGDVSVAKAQLQHGETVEVQWQERNTGTASVTAARQWQIWLSSDELLDATDRLLASGASTPSIIPGSFTVLTASVTVPLDSDLPNGPYRFLVLVDASGDIVESDEADNLRASSAVQLTLPPLPNLHVSQIDAPPTALPGSAVTVGWTVHNSGSLPAVGSWTETVYVTSDVPGVSDRIVGSFRYSQTLEPDSELRRSETVHLPGTQISGDARFRVAIDTERDIAEENELDNTLIGETRTEIAAILVLASEYPAVREDRHPASFRGFLTRTGSLAEPLIVSLSQDMSGELAVPLEVAIPAGHASVAFPITVRADGTVDGDQIVTLTASAVGHVSAQASVQVLDVDRPMLAIEVAAEPMQEGDRRMVTVRRGTPTVDPVVVRLTTNAGSQLSFPTSVTIPAGASAVSFELVAVDDAVAEPARVYTLRARADGHLDGQANLAVAASDLPQLTLTIDRSRFNESAGPFAATGTIRLATPAPTDLLVRLEVSDHSELYVPPSVVIPANQQEIRFAVSAVDDQSLDGAQVVLITATAMADDGGGPLLETSVSAQVTVLDNEGPTLQLSLARTVVRSGLDVATTGTVTRPVGSLGAITVMLASSDATLAAVPQFVTIPAGNPSATFSIATPANAALTGDQRIEILASVNDTAIAMAAEELVVTQRTLPDLRVLRIESPTEAVSGSLWQLRYEIENQGPGSFSGEMLERVFLSRDPYPGDDTLLAQFLFQGALAAGQSTVRTVPIEAPGQLGEYWIVVRADAAEQIEEIREDNNAAVSQRLTVTGAYSAHVQTDIDVAPAGSVIPLAGVATLAGSGNPAANVPVNVHVLVDGTRRVFSTRTDSAGRFRYDFEPLPGEAGHYEIAATHPGVSRPEPQDGFILLGLRTDVTRLSVRAVAGGPARTAQTPIRNATDQPLAGLAVEVLNVPQNLTVAATLGGQSLDGLASTSLVIDVAASSESRQTVELIVRVTSQEGVELRVPVRVDVVPLAPRLVALTSPLKAGMVRGRQSLIEFEVVNQGGAAAEQVLLRLPNESWLQAVSATALGTLAPQDSRTISLLLNPTVAMPLGVYRGELVLQTADASWRVPFEFRLVSEAVGAIAIQVVDEYTYYVAGAPKVAGAHVTLFDAVTGEQKLVGVTDAEGRFQAENLREGSYDMLIEADGHARLRSLVQIQAGHTTELQPFIAREVVQYNFTVIPTEVEDRTRIELQTVFETNVPIPVVVVEPGYIDFNQLMFVQGVADLEFTLTNYGLIAAQNVVFELPRHPNYEFHSLVRDVGTLPANSSLRIPVRIRDRAVEQQAPGAVLEGLIKAVDEELILTGQTIRVTHIDTGEQFYSVVLEDGSFLFEGLPAGPYRYDLENAVLVSPPVTHLESNERRQGIRLQAAAGSTLSGIVGDATTGASLAGFTVTLTAQTVDGKDALVQANGAGEYWFGDVAAGEYILAVYSPAAELRYRRPISISEAQTVHSPVLGPAGALSGTVVDDLTGKAISDGFVVVEGRDDQWPYASQPLAAGQFHLQGIPAGEYTLRVLRDGYVDFARSVVVAGGQAGELELALTPLGGLRGDVVASSGQALPRMTVVIRSADQQIIQVLVTDATGRYEASSLEPGQYTVTLVTAGAEQLLSQTMTVTAGEVASVPALRVDLVARVVGTVFNRQDQPVEGAIVSLLLEGRRLLSTRSDSAGRFEIGILRPGNYQVVAATGDTLYERVTVSITEGGAGEVAIQLQAGERTLSGIAVAEDATPIAGAEVSLHPSGPNAGPALRGQTNAAGEFSFENLPAGDYTLTFIKTGLATTQLAATVTSADLAGLAVSMPAAVTFGGRVTEFSGAAVAGAIVIASTPGSGAALATATSDEEGMFQFDSLGPSTIELRIVASGFLPATIGPIDPADQAAPIAVTVATSANSLSGVVRRADGGVWDEVTVTAVDEQGRLIAQVQTDQMGAYRFDSLPASAIVVSAAIPGFTVARATIGSHELPQATRDFVLSPVAYDLSPSLTDPFLAGEGEREPHFIEGSVLRNLYKSFHRRDDEPSRPVRPPEGCCRLDHSFAQSRWEEMNAAFAKIDVRQDELQSQFWWSMLRAAGLGFDLTLKISGIVFSAGRVLGKLAEFRDRIDHALDFYSIAQAVTGSIDNLWDAIRGRVEPGDVERQALTTSDMLVRLGTSLGGAKNEVLRLSERLAYDPSLIAEFGPAAASRVAAIAGDIIGIADLVLSVRDAADAVVEEARKIAVTNLRLRGAINYYHIATEHAKYFGQRYENCLLTCDNRCEGPNCQNEDDDDDNGGEDGRRGGACVIYGGIRWTLHCGAGDVHYRARTTWDNASDLCDPVPSGRGGGSGGSGEPRDPFVHPPRQLRPAGPGCNQAGGEGESANQGICAQVRIQLDQTAVINREAFQAQVELVNAHADADIEALDIQLMVLTASGEAASLAFAIRDPRLSGIDSLGGNGRIAVGGRGTARWIILPSIDAASDQPVRYFVGGFISYVQDGAEVRIDLDPVEILVHPSPALELSYFQQRDVYADDPFTPEIEPRVPFSLGLIVRNVGAGVARNLRIESAQPRIIENAKGLDTSFTIIGSQVDGQPGTPSLTLNLGDVAPGQSKVGQWIFTTPLQGHFIEYQATFTHEDSIHSGVDVSLIRNVEVFELVHIVYADRTFDDGRVDFLTNDLDDPLHTPDTLHLSDGRIEIVGLMAGTASKGAVTQSGLEAQLAVESAQGWRYLRIADPGEGRYRLERVLRADGTEVPAYNFWQTDRSFQNRGERPVYEDILHLLDFSPSGDYTLIFVPKDSEPPAVVEIAAVSPDPISAPVESLDIRFSKPIDPASVGIEDLLLTRDGNANLIDERVTIVQLSETEFRISGLAGLTGTDGHYVLTANAAGITDLAGIVGVGVFAESWVKSEAAPAVEQILGLESLYRNEPVDTVDVVFTKAINPGSFSHVDLQLLRDGVPVNASGQLVIAQVQPRTYRIFGLGALTDTDGQYRLQIDATGIEGVDGLAGVGRVAATWIADMTPPGVQSTAPSQGVYRSTFDQLQLQFNEIVMLSAGALSRLHLTRDGILVPLQDNVSVVQLDEQTVEVRGLSAMTSSDGVYILQIGAGLVHDQAGNIAAAVPEMRWTLDTQPPASPTGLAISPDVGGSPTDGLTNTRQLILSGTVGDNVHAVRVLNATTGQELVAIPVEGRSFAFDIELPADGFHPLRVLAVDEAGNVSAASPLEVFVDTTEPVARFSQPNNPPRGDAVDAVDLEFSEPINALTLDDFHLVRNGVSQPLDKTVATLLQVAANRWRLAGIASQTTLPGSYELRLKDDGGTISDAAGNLLKRAAQAVWMAEPRWQNRDKPLDVNRDGVLTPLDALVGINRLNELGARILPATAPVSGEFYYDASGDGFHTPNDVLQIINALNSLIAAEGEGVAASVSVSDALRGASQVASSLHAAAKSHLKASPGAELLGDSIRDPGEDSITRPLWQPPAADASDFVQEESAYTWQRNVDLVVELQEDQLDRLISDMVGT